MRGTVNMAAMPVGRCPACIARTIRSTEYYAATGTETRERLLRALHVCTRNSPEDGQCLHYTKLARSTTTTECVHAPVVLWADGQCLHPSPVTSGRRAAADNRNDPELPSRPARCRHCRACVPRPRPLHWHAPAATQKPRREASAPRPLFHPSCRDAAFRTARCSKAGG